MTALLGAAQLHDTETVRLLLEYGANPDKTIASPRDETRLLLALERPGGTDVIALSIENKTNLRAPLHQDLRGSSGALFEQYLIEAVTNKDFMWVELLTDDGADINALLPLCQPSALQTAIEADDMEIIDILLAQSVDPNLQPPSKLCPWGSGTTLSLTAAARCHSTKAPQKLM
ncbi:multiple ankyrin repeats single kh domain-containing protein [Fusarium mexicanum]|uniref:Multiple ankyrin repeats single kh domain-containing protein n=1 Tax=Fusarium mexicanum TaxID=751941 RepID=A0A8H5MMS2_9HYPO|nr:multiple ankyrin repeats single kh domain-containing protein [Fusarium mexicanum]